MMEASVGKVARVFEIAQERKAALEAEIKVKRQQLREAQDQTQEESLLLARNGAYVQFLQRNCKLVRQEVDQDLVLRNNTKESLHHFFQLSDSFGADFEVMKKELVELCTHRDMLKSAVTMLQGASERRKAEYDMLTIQHDGLVQELGQLEQACIDQNSLVTDTQAFLATVHDEKQAAESKELIAKKGADKELQALRASEDAIHSYDAERKVEVENQQKEKAALKREIAQAKEYTQTNKEILTQTATKITTAESQYSHLVRDSHETTAENVKLVNSDKETRAATASIKKRLVETQEARAKVGREHQLVTQALESAEAEERKQEQLLDQMHSSVDAEKEHLAKGMQEHSQLSSSLPVAHAQLHQVQKCYHATLDSANNEHLIAQVVCSEAAVTLAKTNDEVAVLNQRVETSSKELAEMQAQKAGGQRKIDELKRQLVTKMTAKMELDISTKHEQASKLEAERKTILAKMSDCDASTSEDEAYETTESVIVQAIAEKKAIQEAEFKQGTAHELHEIQAKIDKLRASEHLEQAELKHRKKVEALHKAIGEAKSQQQRQQRQQSQQSQQGQHSVGQGQRNGKTTVKSTVKSAAKSTVKTIADVDNVNPQHHNVGKAKPANPARAGPAFAQNPAARSACFSSSTSTTASASAATRTFSMTKKPLDPRMTKLCPGDDWFNDDAVWG